MKIIIILTIILTILKKSNNQCIDLIKIIKNTENEISNYIKKNINNIIKD